MEKNFQLPLFVKNCLHETILVFSFADVLYGFGAIIAALITRRVLKRTNPILFTILLIIITGYSFLVMVKVLELNAFFLATLVIGLTNASARITRMSYFFKTIPNKLIGRTNTIFNSINTLIRAGLILIFSAPWFSEGNNVIIGYKIGIFVLILFTIPLMFQIRNKLK